VLSTTPQPLGSWTGSGQSTGTLTYTLANSWNYASSTTPYQATLTYTLTSP
jgi:hypothetical protein